MQHRVGVAVEPAGVEQRQHGEQHRRRRDIGGTAEVDAIPERHAVGDDRALGLAGRARGVHDGRDVIERDVFEAIERLRGCDRRLIGTARSEQQRRRDVAEFCDRQRDLGQIGIVDHHLRRGIADDVLQFGNGEAGVQRQEHGADPETGELHLERIGRVQRQHRDAVAALDAESVAQMRGKARDPRVEAPRRKAGVRSRGRWPRSCPACGGRNGRSSRNGEWTRLPPRPAVLRRLFCLMALSLADEGSYGDTVLRGVAEGTGRVGRRATGTVIARSEATKQSRPSCAARWIASRSLSSAGIRPTRWLAMTEGGCSAHSISISKHSFTISRLDLPEACYRISLPSEERAQGMLGARCTAVSCAIAQKKRTRAYRFSGGIRHSLRNGFTAYIVLLCPQNLPECANGRF